YAREYVEGMWRMLQHHEPDDFVMATGRTASVRDFCRLVFEQLDLDYEEYIEIDPSYFRPAEVDVLLGDATRAKEVLGWEATTTLEELARIMTAHDYDLALREAHAKRFDAE
ncbi:MAG: GDP-mannose 4,6-dehydratase, partial [Planctomycetaceae bacterium]|nr:GDP-mannose 4,6-dehydratase [Planctomycetaceae bacterium]